MIDFIIVGILIIIVGAAVIYIVRERKHGTKCIGCPAGGQCSGKCSGSYTCGGAPCSCKNDEDTENQLS